MNKRPRETVLLNEYSSIPFSSIEIKDSEVKEGCMEFRKELSVQVALYLRERIPSKIVELNKRMKISDKPGSVLSSEELKPINIDNGKVHSNLQIKELVVYVKQEVSELIEMVSSIKLWVQLNIPQIQDGNNFGVGIQEETIQELGRVEDATFSLYESVCKYYSERARLSSKIVKYPNVEDYLGAIRELDERYWVSLRCSIADMRNNYAWLHDLLTKNWGKLSKPRNSEGTNMVY
ncbi:subunit of proteaseome activator complex [Cryptosporidium ubiquitum]|uniref:Subunit of proteaseome activator complex n=1 Tax=Cryptosporidium ubiquitum TaxID=857276 RepID=A0A1J4MJW0_9CRYT|nr:subunit of proteaseome activator complex [Cryptosporidium ubiquitum]OII73739.1 subunit of proteaseome activator complex [Cryptosporidium ubiquitum]